MHRNETSGRPNRWPTPLPCRSIHWSRRRYCFKNAGAEGGSRGEIGEERPRIPDANDVTLASAMEKEAAHGRAQHGVADAARSRHQRPLVPGEERVERVPRIDGRRHVDELQEVRGATSRRRATATHSRATTRPATRPAGHRRPGGTDRRPRWRSPWAASQGPRATRKTRSGESPDGSTCSGTTRGLAGNAGPAPPQIAQRALQSRALVRPHMTAGREPHKARDVRACRVASLGRRGRLKLKTVHGRVST